MVMDELVIGVVGGMGTYATVDFFRRLADAFPSKKEWDRPRMIIDNYCTMPSRVRAILYNERRSELVEDLSNSVRNLIRSGANRLVLVCNTSHVFLPDIIQAVPESQSMFVNIIEELAKQISETEVRKVGLIASEGTIDSGIYSNIFKPYEIDVVTPDETQYVLLREFIESIKQNELDNETMEYFVDFMNSFGTDAVILGCTELPILYSACVKSGLISNKIVFDPLQSAIDALKRFEG